ncbi:MAG: rhodanese-like domain-containing protein [Hyphomicrobium sp.]
MSRRSPIARTLHALALALLAGLLSAPMPGRADEPEFDAATGYRIARYRSPVPGGVPGGTRVSAGDIDGLVKTQNAILIDVMPSEGAGPDPQTGEWHITKPRQNLPGSVWLADAGKGDLPPLLETYFKTNLERLTAGAKTRAIVLYCQADCWMSWNAVKRASSYGYTALYWFAEGTDGWRDWDGTFADATPMPVSSNPAVAP